MKGEDDRVVLRDLFQRLHDAKQSVRLVDVGGTMEGDGDVILGFDPQRLENAAVVRLGKELHQAVDHDIANEMDFCGGNPFLQEVLVGVPAGGEKDVGYRIGGEPVDFFGHGAVAAAQAGFDMGDGDAHFDGHEGTGEGGVDVAHHDQQVWTGLFKEFLESDHGSTRLAAVGVGPDAEKVVGPGHAQILEEDIVHQWVVVLASVDEDGGKGFGPGFADFPPQRENLHVVGSGSGQEGNGVHKWFLIQT